MKRRKERGRTKIKTPSWILKGGEKPHANKRRNNKKNSRNKKKRVGRTTKECGDEFTSDPYFNNPFFDINRFMPI